MALAPFFARARQSAAQVLRDFDALAFERRLSDVVVVIAFDGGAAVSAEGRCALDMAARLAARLYPRVRLEAIGGSEAAAAELAELMHSINPDIEFVGADDDTRQVAVVVGLARFEASTTIYMGSDRWIARVSTERPIGSGSSGNPVGAGAAACIAMANVFRAVFADNIERPELDADAQFSLLNFELGPRAETADLPSSLDIGLVQLVGVGAIGNAFMWGLARAPGITGTLHAIDHDMVELSNLQRYVLATMANDGDAKIVLASRATEGSRLIVHGFATTWAEYVRGVGHHHFNRVAVALDTARDRVQVQSSLPHRIYNAWTQTGDLGVSRHSFDGEHACLACLYLPSGKRRSEDEIVAEELGLEGQQQLHRVRAMLYHGEPVGEAFVREIAQTSGADVEVLLPFASLPLRAFRQRAVCGNAIMRALDGYGADIQVPMAFQSALAGVMLAAEVIASSPGVRAAQPATRTVIDLMRRLPSYATTPVLKGAPGAARCICQDQDWQDAFRSKYATAV